MSAITETHYGATIRNVKRQGILRRMVSWIGREPDHFSTRLGRAFGLSG